ncbi:MAG: hypothetical protein M3122_02585 [Actinomycetota bacterium]|nr:hypothetical protein [Actinomycetota bacterium]
MSSGAANAMPIFVWEARGTLVTHVRAATPFVQKNRNGVFMPTCANATPSRVSGRSIGSEIAGLQHIVGAS